MSEAGTHLMIDGQGNCWQHDGNTLRPVPSTKTGRPQLDTETRLLLLEQRLDELERSCEKPIIPDLRS